ncbi:MAG: guanylate kinase [Candidatus Omnitrophota bacterium]|nr:MAG: guanylate kinase [Candidatus Omnitrophota bacterium]
MPIAKIKKKTGIPNVNSSLRISSGTRRFGTIFVVSAPSGCGKTTLCKRLLKNMPGLCRSASFTTRAPRRGERDGIDYHFVSTKEFKTLIKKGKFIEHARVFGNFYGTPSGPIKKTLKNNKDILLSIDVKGAMQIKRLLGPRSVFIFILPPSLDALNKRLMKRHADSKGEINKRLEIAKEELSYLHKYDYAIVNCRLKDALSQLEAVIIAERLKIRKH